MMFRLRRLLASSLFSLTLLASALPVAALGVALAWDYTDGVDPATDFLIYRAQGPCTAPGPFLNIGIVPRETLTYTDLAVSPNSTYCWYVTALDAARVESDPSNRVQFLVQQPAQPQNLQGTIVR